MRAVKRQIPLAADYRREFERRTPMWSTTLEWQLSFVKATRAFEPD